MRSPIRGVGSADWPELLKIDNNDLDDHALDTEVVVVCLSLSLGFVNHRVEEYGTNVISLELFESTAALEVG